jgi:hypothetical protein
MQRQQAVRMLRFHKVTMTGRMRKATAVATLAHFYAARIVQRWFRRATQVNAVCPISLEPVVYPCVSVRASRCAYVRYNMAAFHEFLSSATSAVVREPTTNRPITPRTMRRITRGMASMGFSACAPRAHVAHAGAPSVLDCLETVVDGLMAEVLDDDAYVDHDAIAEWARNVECAVASIATHSRAHARLKLGQCIASCACTAACGARDYDEPCQHATYRATLARMQRALR